MAVDFGDLSTPAGISALNAHLAAHSYISGFSGSQDDIITLKKLRDCANFAVSKGCTEDSCAHVCRWYNHISSFSAIQIAALPKGLLKETPVVAKPVAAKPAAAKDDDDDFDLFGDDGGSSAADMKKMTEAVKAAKPKKVVINKSSLVIEVKPCSIKSDLDEVWKMIKNIQIEGVTWGEACKKVPLAFGLFKLQVSCVILDDVVQTEDITDRIEELGMTEEQVKEMRKRKDQEEEIEEDEEEEDEDADDVGLVQSAEIVSFNKL